MNIKKIKEDISCIEQKNKSELIDIINMLFVREKQLNNKIITLNTEIKFIERQLDKIKELITRTLQTKIKTDKPWQK